MNTVKEAFNHSFEQVAVVAPAEFFIHGIGYRGKWGKDTMATFIKDLESHAGLKTHAELRSDIRKLSEANASLEYQNRELSTKLRYATNEQ